MSWTIDHMYMLFFTTISGMLLTWIWRLLGVWLEKIGFLHISYQLAKIVMIFWFIPFSYSILWIWDDVKGRWGGDLLLATPATDMVSKLFFIGWMTGVLVLFIKYVLETVRVFKLRKTVILCVDRANRIFRQMVQSMGITQNVMLRQSYFVMVPQLIGVIRPMVILPVKEYTTEELNVIFAHELTHVRHRDVLWKNLAMILRIIHFINPVAWGFHKMLDKWSEFACDYEVCTSKMDIKHYYEVIADMAQEMRDVRSTAVCLVEDEGKLTERMRHVIRSYNIKSKSEVSAAVLLAVIVLFSGGTVYAAAVKSADILQYVNEETAVEIEVEQDPELQEYVELETDPDVNETVGTVTSSAESGCTELEWNMEGESLTKSPEFWVKSGEYISITVTNPSRKGIRVGIIEPDNTKTYVTDSRNVIHDFEVSTTGNYRVYIQNMDHDSADMTVTGSYYVY